MTRTGFYSGSFDPITNGHIDVLKQASHLFDEIVIGVGIHPGKQPLFTFEQRADLIRSATAYVKELPESKLKVVSFDNLVVDAARANGAGTIIRGLRDGTDLDYEMQMAGMNGRMAPHIPTIFLPASPEVRPITATLVRQIAKMGGNVSGFVPRAVEHALKRKFETSNQ